MQMIKEMVERNKDDRLIDSLCVCPLLQVLLQYWEGAGCLHLLSSVH